MAVPLAQRFRLEIAPRPLVQAVRFFGNIEAGLGPNWSLGPNWCPVNYSIFQGDQTGFGYHRLPREHPGGGPLTIDPGERVAFT